jgi:hypothetical protein
MMKKTIPLTNRRKFLVGAGLGTAGVAAALATRPGAVAKHAEASEPPAPAHDGYRATDHVLKYYKTTEV